MLCDKTRDESCSVKVAAPATSLDSAVWKVSVITGPTPSSFFLLLASCWLALSSEDSSSEDSSSLDSSVVLLSISTSSVLVAASPFSPFIALAFLFFVLSSLRFFCDTVSSSLGASTLPSKTSNISSMMFYPRPEADR